MENEGEKWMPAAYVHFQYRSIRDVKSHFNFYCHSALDAGSHYHTHRHSALRCGISSECHTGLRIGACNDDGLVVGEDTNH